MNRRSVWLVLLLPCPALLPGGTAANLPGKEPATAPTRKVMRFSPRESDPARNPHRFVVSPEAVIDPKDGSLRLAHSVLVADEMGATDWRETEPLSARVWARKDLVLDSPEVARAELFVYGSAREIRVNGRPVGHGSRLVSTGWTRVPVPTAFLKAGRNEVVLSGAGSLLLEPGRQPRRSFKSADGGKTWSRDNLSREKNQQGEYLVRLRLARYAPRGGVRSPVLDLWAGAAGAPATPGKVVAIQGLAGLPTSPRGTRLVAWLRTGSTPTPDGRNWTDWFRADNASRPGGAAARHRWAQLRFDLATDRPQETPRLPARFELAVDFQPDPGLARDRVEILPDPPDQPAVAPGSVPFVYQAPSPRLKLLREKYRLDRVIAPGRTEMEQLMLLRHWVRNQWHTAWGSHPAAWMPPWDALQILAVKDQPDCLTMCTHYAAVFTQCCLALGWNARHCILDHHCTAEVWVNQHRKWVLMDAGNSAERPDCTLHFERGGVPLSALELHRAAKRNRTGDITAHFTPARLMAKIAPLCRPAPAARGKKRPRPDVIPAADLPKYPVCSLANYRRYAFPGRNNYLDSLYPGELYQGWAEYFYDGYWWVGDDRDDPRTAPEYTRHLPASRPGDIDWPLNGVRARPARTARAGELEVTLETFTPNLDHLEKADGESPPRPGDWKTTSDRFVWRLRPGLNTLRLRSLNRFHRAGPVTVFRVRWTPASR